MRLTLTKSPRSSARYRSSLRSAATSTVAAISRAPAGVGLLGFPVDVIATMCLRWQASCGAAAPPCGPAWPAPGRAGAVPMRRAPPGSSIGPRRARISRAAAARASRRRVRAQDDGDCALRSITEHVRRPVPTRGHASHRRHYRHHRYRERGYRRGWLGNVRTALTRGVGRHLHALRVEWPGGKLR